MSAQTLELGYCRCELGLEVIRDRRESLHTATRKGDTARIAVLQVWAPLEGIRLVF